MQCNIVISKNKRGQEKTIWEKMSLSRIYLLEEGKQTNKNLRQYIYHIHIICQHLPLTLIPRIHIIKSMKQNSRQPVLKVVYEYSFCGINEVLFFFITKSYKYL